jgi:hypothetical protein
MSKVIKLTEQDLVRLAKRVIQEQSETLESFLQMVKKDFLKKGFKLIKSNYSLLSMYKRPYTVDFYDEGGQKKLILSDTGTSPESTIIYLNNYSMFGPFVVEYFKGGKKIKTEKLDGYKIGQLLQNFG